jgi:hypothetical protein
MISRRTHGRNIFIGMEAGKPLKVKPENRAAVIGQRLSEWADLARQEGVSVAERRRGRNNFKNLAKDNPSIARQMAVFYGYENTLRKFTPELAKKGGKS